MHICIIGDIQDLTATYIKWLAQQREMEILELPEGTLGLDWTYHFDDTAPEKGHFQTLTNEYSFGAIGGAFVRLHHEPSVPSNLDLPAQERALFIRERRGALLHLLNALPCVVANRPTAGRTNGSKPLQMQQLTRAGFDVPEWIATNDPAVTRAFCETHRGGVIYKTCSGVRARVRMIDPELLKRMDNGTSPVVIQAYIQGVDVRVHTVGEQAFPTQIESRGVDYRYQAQGSLYTETTMPQGLADRCCQVAAEEGLVVAGFDFRVTEDGTWYCLEVNPMPTFLPYEMATRQPIGAAILNLFSTP
jgi:glutathione synthase/RimK-type ligase-like ATP-grasp enzyme